MLENMNSNYYRHEQQQLVHPNQKDSARMFEDPRKYVESRYDNQQQNFQTYDQAIVNQRNQNLEPPRGSFGPIGDKQNQEQFFEALGLPGNLSRSSVEKFQYQSYAQRQSDIPFSVKQESGSNTPQMFQSQYGQRMVTNETNQTSDGDKPQPGDLFGDSTLSAIAPTQSQQPRYIPERHFGQQQYQTAQFKEGFGQQNEQQQRHSQRNLNKELLTITIEIGNGQNENIIIREGDSPRALAKQFSMKHEISDQLRELLSEQIRLNIESVKASSSYNASSRPDHQATQKNSAFHDPQQPVVYDERMDEVMSLLSQHSRDTSNKVHQLSSHDQTKVVEARGNGRSQIISTGLPSLSCGTSQPGTRSTAFSPKGPQQAQQITSQQQEMPSNREQTFNNHGDHIKEYVQYQGSSEIASNQIQSNRYNSRQADSQPVTMRSLNNAQGFVDPTSQDYLNWYRGVNNKLHNQAGSKLHASNSNLPPNQNKPSISSNSQKIIDQKRFGSTQGSQGQMYGPSVHQRLYQGALAKQRALKTLDVNDSAQSDGRMSNDLKNRRSSGQPPRMMTRSSSNMMPRGQYKMMLDRQKAETKEHRASSVQGSRTPQQHWNSTGKQRLSERKASCGSNSGRNYGELLYERGMRRKEEMKKIQQRAKSEQDRQEIENHTFKPQINQVSKNMRRVNNEKPEDFLMKYGKAVKEKIDYQRVESLRAETQGLTFKPQVSKLSEKIVQQKESQQSGPHSKYGKFDSLYQDAQRRQERQEFIYSACIESECTFQPDTEKTKFFNSKASSMRSEGGSNSVYERLSQRLNSSQDRSRMLIENSRSLTNELFDPETGQALFQPQVGRAPRGRSRQKNQNPGEKLYQDALKSRERKDSLRREEQKQKKFDASRNHSKRHTNKLVENAKIQNFAAIFDQLDSDGDGQISAYRIDISSLPSDLLQVLTPLFVEMEELGMNLNEEEFIDAACRLYKSVSIPERSVLVNRKRSSSRNRNEDQDQKMFQPQINANSRKLAQMKAPGNVATRLYDKKKEYDTRIMEKRYQRENNELLGCTFQPKILQQSPGNFTHTTTNGGITLSGTLGNTMGMKQWEQQQQLTFNNSQRTNQFSNTHGSVDINNVASNVVNELLQNQQNNYLMPLQISQQNSQKPPAYPFAQQHQVQFENKENKSDNRVGYQQLEKQNRPSSAYGYQLTVGGAQETRTTEQDSNPNESINQFLMHNPSTIYQQLTKPPLKSNNNQQSEKRDDGSLSTNQTHQTNQTYQSQQEQ